jgi:HEAT repeat protein
VRHRSLWFTAVLYLMILATFTCGQDAPSLSKSTAGSSQDILTPAVSPEETAARQLRIYRDALLQGSTDVIRIDAAVALLVQNDAGGREILLTALKNDENPLAQLAVCKALIKSRGLSQTLSSRQEFLEPLLLILQGKSAEQAMVAAEALLIFDYSTIEQPIRQLLEDKELGRQIRIQAIDALQLRPEPQALRILIGLLDDSDTEVAKAAEASLQEAFGIPVGTSRSVWADILVELQQKSPEDIRRERLLRQETKLREIQTERDRWQKLYLVALDRQYESSDEAGRTKMIQDAMASDLAAMRIWMLEKIAKNPVAAERIKTALFAMLADPSRDVRLQTAKVLTNMSALNPAEKLLERVKVEKDSEIALAMFEALGEACFFAYSPGSGIELPIEIKMETLKIASGYLNRETADPVKKGAEVIRKILELNNLPTDTARDYLTLLYQRYEKSKTQTPALRADLLGVLAHLCGQGALRTAACGMYEPLFAEAIREPNNAALRLSAAKGMVYVDKVKALELFRSMQLNKDESLSVQQVVIEATGQAGGVEDLDWLITSLLSNVYSEQAWLAVKNICQRQKATFLVDWICALETAPGVTAEQIREILEIAELKAEGENNLPLITQVRERIIAILTQRRSWEQASAYLLKFNYSENGFEFDEDTKIEIMRIYLYTNQAEKALLLFESKLAVADLSESSPWASAMMSYLLDDTVSPDNKRIVLEKAGMLTVQDRPNWITFIQEARKLLNLMEMEAIPAEDIGMLVSGSNKK